jgi:hypothetical protein
MFECQFTPLYYDNSYGFTPVTSISIPKNFMPNEPFLIRAIEYRKTINMNTFIVALGGNRIGKSWNVLSILDELHKKKGLELNIKKQCSFDVLPFLKWSKKAFDSYFMLEEVGVSLSTVEWWDITSIIMRNFTQTQGYRLNTLFLILPNIGFIQKHFRSLGNYTLTTWSRGYATIHKIKTNPLMGKWLPIFVENMFIKKPRLEVLEPYEKMKHEWNEEQLDKDIEYIDLLNQKRKQPYDKRTVKELRIKYNMLKIAKEECENKEERKRIRLQQLRIKDKILKL